MFAGVCVGLARVALASPPGMGKAGQRPPRDRASCRRPAPGAVTVGVDNEQSFEVDIVGDNEREVEMDELVGATDLISGAR